MCEKCAVNSLILSSPRGPRIVYEVVGGLGYSRNKTHVCVLDPSAHCYEYRYEPKTKLRPCHGEQGANIDELVASVVDTAGDCVGAMFGGPICGDDPER